MYASKKEWKGLKCLTFFTLWFWKRHLPCSRLWLGHSLGECAGRSLVGVDAPLRCQGYCRSYVFILLFDGRIGGLWELLEYRGGLSAARQCSVTGRTGRVPV